MTLRRRLTLMSAVAVGVTVALASLVCYLAMRSELRAQVDRRLRAQRARPGSAPCPAARCPRHRGAPAGRPSSRRSSGPTASRAIARAGWRSAWSAAIGPRPGEGGVRSSPTARPTACTSASSPSRSRAWARCSSAVRWRASTPCSGACDRARAARARRAPRSPRARAPVRAAGHPAHQRAHARGRAHRGHRRPGAPHRRARRGRGRADGAALRRHARPRAGLQAAQRQLVADASHELRTPVTALRTNMEVMLAGAELEEGERRALLRDMVGQSEELSGLVGDLIELARGDEGDPPIEDVALDALVAEAVARARRHAPGPLPDRARAVRDRRRARPARPRGQQRPRQRRRVQPARRRGRGRTARRRARGPRPRSGGAGGRVGAALRPLLPRRAAARAARTRASDWPSCGRSPRRTERRSRPPTPPAAGWSSALRSRCPPRPRAERVFGLPNFARGQG